jgi:hypothetical protein
VEELKDVKGIGAKRFEKIKSDLAVSGPNTGIRTAATAGKAQAGNVRAEAAASGGKQDGRTTKP